MRNATQFLLLAAVGGVLAAAAPARAGLISHWAGEGNALDSTGNNPGTLVGGVAFGPGRIGQAFRFDGANYVEAGTVGMPTGNQDRTIFLWFNVSSNIAHEAFFAGYGAFGNYNEAYEIFGRDNTLYFSQWGRDVSGGTFGLGEWHSAAVTNVGDSLTLYFDGSEVATGTLPIDTPAGTSFYIGRIPGNLGDTRRLDGFVDEVRVYDTALSTEQIQALHNLPEPSTFLLLLAGAGLLGLLGIVRQPIRSAVSAA